MKVKIKKGFHPNIEAIRAKFPLEGNEIFTYGNTIYTPGRLTKSLLAHERVHVRQQLRMGVEFWWQQYLVSAPFRLTQELEAHQVEWQMGGRMPELAARLSSKLYGNLVSHDKAVILISKGKRPLK